MDKETVRSIKMAYRYNVWKWIGDNYNYPYVACRCLTSGSVTDHILGIEMFRISGNDVWIFCFETTHTEDRRPFRTESSQYDFGIPGIGWLTAQPTGQQTCELSERTPFGKVNFGRIRWRTTLLQAIASSARTASWPGYLWNRPILWGGVSLLLVSPQHLKLLDAIFVPGMITSAVMLRIGTSDRVLVVAQQALNKIRIWIPPLPDVPLEYF